MRTRRRGWAIWVAVAATLAVIAVVAVAILLLLRRDGPEAREWQEPMGLVVPANVTPQLALYPLAGASEIEAIDAGIDNGDWMSAYAGLVYGLELSDRQRIGRLSDLGDRLGDTVSRDLAPAIFQQVYDLAVLSPELNDPQRADALIRAARGLGNAGRYSQALRAMEQAQLVATGSPFLQPAQRRSILVRLEDGYRDLGEDELAQDVRMRIVELDQGGAPQPTGIRAMAADLPAEQETISSAEVGALEENRRVAAFAVIEALSTQGQASPDSVTALAEALKAEDAAKLVLYGRELEATTQAGRRSEIHRLLIRWLLIKTKVAELGFGLSFVPEWESQKSDIQAALSKAYEDLAFDYEDWSASLPDAAQMLPSSYAALRSILLSGRLGQYPNFPQEQLIQKLLSAVDGMVAAGFVSDLYVTAREIDGELRFLLSSSADLISSP